jgi:phosphohistidine phosphatase SixA
MLIRIGVRVKKIMYDHLIRKGTGRQHAGQMAANGSYLTDQVISSTAARTLETYQRLGTQAAF